LSIADQELAKELEKLKDKVKILETSEVIQRMAGGTRVPETTTAGTTLAQSAQTTITEPDITEARRRVDHLEKLLDFLETEFGSTKKSYAEFIANGQITYHMLWFLFRINKCMIFEDDQSGLAMAGQVYLR
jgi:tetrahydromethanopterin S-methyltransferase subunit G